ncbi:MAG: hypothetical protein NOU37_00835 [Candidatus Brocadiales bacterium]|nr:hypothetical protein [Candidatus Bathyanammoxibius amoris]
MESDTVIAPINERVKVGAVFGDGEKIKPVWFKWNSRQHRIKSITYTWTSRQGRAVIHHFSVTDGANLYELLYNTENSVWELANVETG